MKHRLIILFLALSVAACGCQGTSQRKSKGSAQPALKNYTFRIVAELPHSTSDYTQGFQYADGYFWEGTGGYGSSELKTYPLDDTSTPQRSISLARTYFGEGITLLGERVYQLTWRKGKAFVYERSTLRKVGEYDYEGEGWGLTTDGKVLYMSDGSDVLTVRDADTFKPLRTISVTTAGRKAENLNELEWVAGEIWANVYLTDTILRINPESGKVVGIIDLTGLQSPLDVTYSTDVLNGIAYDSTTGRLWLTGKNWNKIYQVEIVEK